MVTSNDTLQMKDENRYLGHQLLIAMPAMDDPNFARTVIYVCEHNRYGAMGIIINRPMSMNLEDMLSHIQVPFQSEKVKETAILYGGPLHQDRGFVLHATGGVWRSSLPLKELSITTSKDILEAMGNDSGPKQALVSLGCVGWGAGQLEEEMLNNLWLTVDVDLDILFNVPYAQRWEMAAQSIGVDISQLSGDAGHA